MYSSSGVLLTHFPEQEPLNCGQMEQVLPTIFFFFLLYFTLKLHPGLNISCHIPLNLS